MELGLENSVDKITKFIIRAFELRVLFFADLKNIFEFPEKLLSKAYIL